MKKWMVLGVLVMLVLLGGGGFWVYGNMGIKKFVDMMRYIETFPVELRIKAKAEFNGGSDGLYTGALMKVGLKNEGVVWVWGKNGPRKYEMDENSVLSYYSMCKNEGLLDKLSKEERVQTSRNIYTSEELLEWKDKVKAGDYAVVMKATEKHGGNLGKLREVWVYDWWPMIPMKMEEQCKR